MFSAESDLSAIELTLGASINWLVGVRRMKILVTAGNTQTPIDRVRSITNIFSGRTGARIAARAFNRTAPSTTSMPR